MSTPVPAVDRIVVAFDSYCPAGAALELALQLAGPVAQSVHALYVEESDALTLGAFPWAREVALATAESRPVLQEVLEREFSSRAAAAQALFNAMAAGTRSASFERVRGHMAEELRRTATNAAGILLDWPPARRRSRSWARMVARTLLELRAPFVGLVEAGKVRASALLIVRSQQGSGRAHDLACRLMRGEAAQTTEFRGQVTAAAVLERARQVQAGALLVEQDAAADAEALLAELASRWSGSLLLLR